MRPERFSPQSERLGCLTRERSKARGRAYRPKWAEMSTHHARPYPHSRPRTGARPYNYSAAPTPTHLVDAEKEEHCTCVGKSEAAPVPRSNSSRSALGWALEMSHLMEAWRSEWEGHGEIDDGAGDSSGARRI